MARNPLTPSECKQILDLRKTGTGVAKIAKEMHRGTKTISEFLKSSETNKSPPKEGNQDFSNVSPPKEGNQDFSNVSFEHRAIIKFLSKLGKENQGIFKDMKAAYKRNYPSIKSIDYWATQFKNGQKLVLQPKKRGRPKLKPRPKVWMWVQTKPRAPKKKTK